MMHAGRPETVQPPAAEAAVGALLEDLYQVVLFNDDHNTMDHVVGSLMRVFAHPRRLAEKIMAEAHRRGRAIAEVEAGSAARLHRDQLQSLGLTAAVEKV